MKEQFANSLQDVQIAVADEVRDEKNVDGHGEREEKEEKRKKIRGEEEGKEEAVNRQEARGKR